MPSVITNFPLVALSDGIISFLQYQFGNAQVTPGEYRWNSNERASKIFISAPYTITRDKVEAQPTITIGRANFAFQNRVIDNLKSADAITQENPVHMDLVQGPLIVTIEAQTGSEATGLASFVALLIQSNRKMLAGQLKFIQSMRWTGISNETPVEEAAEIQRWQCTLTYQVIVYMGWLKRTIGPVDRFNKANIYHAEDPPVWDSIYGEVTAGSPNLVDQSANFGFLTTNEPQILESEFNHRWYYVNFGDDPKKYTVEQIVNNKTLKLSVVDANGDTVDFNPTQSEKGKAYKLLWNSVHINVEIPKKS